MATPTRAAHTRLRILLVDLDRRHAPGRGDSAVELLDDDERRRAAAFVNATDRRRYVDAHAALRRALGEAMDQDPASIGIRRSPCPVCGAGHGKPVVDDGPHISLSRSAGWAAIAIDTEAPVGIDIELRSPRRRLEPLRAQLLAPGERSVDLLRTWVRKEALLKRSGAGLSRPMTDFPARDEGIGDLLLPRSSRLVATVATTGRSPGRHRLPLGFGSWLTPELLPKGPYDRPR